MTLSFGFTVQAEEKVKEWHLVPVQVLQTNSFNKGKKNEWMNEWIVQGRKSSTRRESEGGEDMKPSCRDEGGQEGAGAGEWIKGVVLFYSS